MDFSYIKTKNYQFTVFNLRKFCEKIIYSRISFLEWVIMLKFLWLPKKRKYLSFLFHLQQETIALFNLKISRWLNQLLFEWMKNLSVFYMVVNWIFSSKLLFVEFYWPNFLLDLYHNDINIKVMVNT